MNTIPQVPQEIREASQAVSNYFEKQGVQEWQLCSIADRRIVTKLESKVKKLQLEKARLLGHIEKLTYLLRESAKSNLWPSPIEIDSVLNRSADILREHRNDHTPTKEDA
jgi:hypothetical protein